MRRRTLLAGVGVGVLGVGSGCSGGDGREQVSIVEQDAIAEEYGVEIEAEVTRDRITPEATARIDVTTTNRRSPKATPVDGSSSCHMLNRGKAGSEPQGLWLYRPEVGDQIERDGDEWQPAPSESRPGPFDGYACGPSPYAAGESVTTRYEMWDDPRTDEYLAPGQYRFGREIPVWDDPGATDRSEDVRLSWGFTVSVDRSQ